MYLGPSLNFSGSIPGLVLHLQSALWLDAGSDYPAALAMGLPEYARRLPPLVRATGDCLSQLRVVGGFSGLLWLDSSTGFGATICSGLATPSTLKISIR